MSEFSSRELARRPGWKPMFPADPADVAKLRDWLSREDIGVVSRANPEALYGAVADMAGIDRGNITRVVKEAGYKAEFNGPRGTACSIWFKSKPPAYSEAV